MTRIICGVDISSASLQASIGRDGAASTFTNNPAGIALLSAFCQLHHAELVAMEATGGTDSSRGRATAGRPMRNKVMPRI